MGSAPYALGVGTGTAQRRPDELLAGSVATLWALSWDAGADGIGCLYHPGVLASMHERVCPPGGETPFDTEGTVTTDAFSSPTSPALPGLL